MQSQGQQGAQTLSENTTILVVDDEENIVDTLKYNLVKQGYRVVTAGNGLTALDVARSEKPDLIILDLFLPGMNGRDVCRILRKETITPILMLTALESDLDKVVGLELGADDYMTKPFALPELIARVRAMLRRMQMVVRNTGALTTLSEMPDNLLTIGDLSINLGAHIVRLKGAIISLKPKEFDLLAYLVQNRGQVLTREMLLNRVWGYDYTGGSRTVDVHMRWLREKIEPDPSYPRYLHTVFGVGYKFEIGSENGSGTDFSAR